MKFTEEHEWLRTEGEIVVVGITEHASTQLGDVVFVELPSALGLFLVDTVYRPYTRLDFLKYFFELLGV